MSGADPFAPKEFAKPPAEVLRYFNEKGLKPSFHWRDVTLDEHAFAFTVAKSAGYDILGDVKKALAEAIERRQDFDVFRKDLEPLLRAKGWWGKARQVDPLTGDEKTVQLGSVRRLRTIYWANVNTAYAAGEWERIWRTRRVLPYLEYLISVARDKRPEHLAQVGTVLPVEDPYWDYWYPPSDWGCECRVRQLSEVEARKRPGFGEPPANLGWRNWTNERTGEVIRIPNGVHPDWANNPGKARGRNAANFLAGKIEAMDEDMRRAAIADLAGSALFRAIASGLFNFDPSSAEPANLSRGQIALPFASLPARIGRSIGATSKSVRLAVKDAKIIGADPNDYAVIQALLDACRVEADGVVTGVVGGEIVSVKLRVEDGGAAVYVEDIRRGE